MFDQESLQDQNTCFTTSHENLSSRTTGQELDGDYKLKEDKTSFNTGKTANQLPYSQTTSQATSNTVSKSGCNSNEACGDEDGDMDQMPSMQDSEITKYANYSEMLQDLGQQSKVVLMQYSQVFGDSEAYEQQAYQAITDLTAHAQLLLQSLNNQKKMLCRRINSISEVLRNDC
ncbi:unnamed protein product [Candidula unifasciata]|uniref:Uncharacterized protein n=1 Tax=Candidula unifasciata TaxID=100452 RepID=A0A8S3ZTD5_9EUPU|nr:unnamed protein product [Candidula unifasciata]